MVNAYRFIEKSSFDDIQEALDSFIEEKRLEERFSLPVVATGDCEFKLSNIEYFETYGRRVKAVLVNGESIEIDLQISDIESLLAEQGFLKVQRSYVVNMSRVKTCDSRNIIMKNGMVIAIGRSNVSEVKKNIIRWKVKHS
jgi:DNA-binding LytR/AlgR family response regulator